MLNNGATSPVAIIPSIRTGASLRYRLEDISRSLRQSLQFFACFVTVSALLCHLTETQGQCLKNSSICSLHCCSSSAGFCSSRWLELGVPGVERAAA
jgi:hypothetical protein